MEKVGSQQKLSSRNTLQDVFVRLNFV